MSKKNKPSLLSMIEHERHRVAASITDARSNEWGPSATPNRGVAKIFLIMLLVHILVVAGLIIYDFASGGSKQTITQAPASEAAPSTETTQSGPENTPSSSGVSLVDPRNDTPAVAAASAEGEDSLNSAQANQAGTSASMPPLPVVSATPGISAGALPPDQGSTGVPVLSPGATRVDLTAADSTSSSSTGAVTMDQVPSASSAGEKIDLAMATQSSSSTAPYSPPSPTAATKTETAPAKAPEVKKTESKPETRPKTPMRTAPTMTKSKSNTPTTAPATAKSTSNRHTVSKGDTLGAIARRYKVSTEALMRANGIKNPNNIVQGARLVIPK
jgi:LysM repeat protein